MQIQRYLTPDNYEIPLFGKYAVISKRADFVRSPNVLEEYIICPGVGYIP